MRFSRLSSAVGPALQHAAQELTKQVSIWATLLCVCAVLWPGTIAHAQTMGTGAIQGTVMDSTGAVIRGATVTAVAPATGYTISQKTTSAGYYVLAQIPPGRYKVTVSATGYQTLVQDNEIVNALETVEFNSTLPAGTVTQTVEVSAEPPQLDTSNGTMGLTIPNSTYSQLPLSMDGGPKSITGFLALLPGVTQDTSTVAGAVPRINGGPSETSFMYMNGMPVVDPTEQGDVRLVNNDSSTEMVDQFQVLNSGVPAYYDGQGVTNFIMKSGTNRFHGSIYENVRNTVFDAAGYFSTSTPVEQQNEYGGTLGGPILKNRMFFFVNMEGFHYKAGSNPVLYSLPTAAERQGNFSALSVPIYDQATIVCATKGKCIFQAFPNNIIPADRISSISQSLQSYLPATTNNSLLNNYSGSFTSGNAQQRYYLKLDASISKNNRMYAITQWGTVSPIGLNAVANHMPPPYTNGHYGSTTTDLVQIGDTEAFTPNLINVFGYQINRFVTLAINPTNGGNYASTAGLTGLPAGQPSEGFPPIIFGGPNAPTPWGGVAVRGYSTYATVNTFQDNVQWVRGKHNITAGGQVQYQAVNLISPSFIGDFAFSNIQTAGYSASGALLNTTGNAYASFLLGAVGGANLHDTSYAPETGVRFKTYAVYAQDDLKLTPRLTLNLGLRYDIFKPLITAKNQASWFDPSLPNPAVSNYPGALRFAGDGPDSCHCSTEVKTHYLALAPRFGFAYELNSSSVIRGAYAINYYGARAIGGATTSGASAIGYQVNPTFTSPAGTTAALNWKTGFPAYQMAPFFDPTLDTGFNTQTGPASGGTLAYNRPNTGGRPPYTQNWNLTFQQAIAPSTVWTLSYAGSVSRLIPIAGGLGIYSDQIDPKYMALGNLLMTLETPVTLAKAQAIFPGISLPYPNFSGSIGQMLRPFPQYAGMLDTFNGGGDASYHSLQMTIQKVMSKGFYFLVAYTWSKSIDDAGGAYMTATGNSRAPRTAYNLAPERSVSSTDIPQSVAISFVYALPFGKGPKDAAYSRLLDEVIGGWQLSGILQYASGAPLGTITGNCLVPYSGTCHADYNPNFAGPVRINGSYGSGNSKGPNPLAYINIKAFQQAPSFTYGDTPMTMAFGLRAPWLYNESLSVAKNFNFIKGSTLRLQADGFNVFNRTRFGGINTNVSNTNFGEVSTQTNAPRKLQFEAYINF